MAQDTTGAGAVVGVVIDSTRQPAPYATVCVVRTTRCELTDQAGRFRLAGLRAGRYRLEIAPPGQPSIVSGDLDVRAGLDTSVEVTMPPPGRFGETVNVTATAQAPPAEIKTSGFLVAPEALENTA